MCDRGRIKTRLIEESSSDEDGKTADVGVKSSHGVKFRTRSRKLFGAENSPMHATARNFVKNLTVKIEKVHVAKLMTQNAKLESVEESTSGPLPSKDSKKVLKVSIKKLCEMDIAKFPADSAEDKPDHTAIGGLDNTPSCSSKTESSTFNGMKNDAKPHIDSSDSSSSCRKAEARASDKSNSSESDSQVENGFHDGSSRSKKNTKYLSCNVEKNKTVEAKGIPRLVLERLTKDEIARFTHRCALCEDLLKSTTKVHVRKAKLNNRLHGDSVEYVDTSQAKTKNLDDSPANSDFDSTDSEIEFTAKRGKARKKISRQKKSDVIYVESDDGLSFSDDNDNDETYVISSDDSEVDTFNPEPEKKKRRLGLNSATRSHHTSSVNNFASESHCSENCKDSSKSNGVHQNSGSNATTRDATNIEVEPSKPMAKTPPASKFTETNLNHSCKTTLIPATVMARLLLLSTPSLQGLLRRGGSLINIIDMKASQINIVHFSQLMLQLQMENRFLTPENAMKFASKRRLEQLVRLRRLRQLKSVIQGYLAELRLLYKSRLVTRSTKHSPFLSSNFGLNFGSQKHKREQPQPSILMDGYPSSNQSSFRWQGLDCTSVPSFKHSTFHFPPVP